MRKNLIETEKNVIKTGELKTIPELAKIMVESGRAANERSARTNLYNKLRYGMEHEIIDRTIYTSLEKLDKYDKSKKKGRPTKIRK